MDATRCPTRHQGRAESRLRTTQRTGVRLIAVPRLLQANNDHERANGTMKSKNCSKIALFLRKREASCERTPQRALMAQSRENRANFGFGNTQHAPYLHLVGEADAPAALLRLPGVAERRRLVQQLPAARRPFRRREPTDCPLHQGISFRPLGLGQLELVRPPPQHHLPAMDGHGVEARRRVGDEGGGGGGGGLLHLGLGGGLKTSSRRSSTASPKWASNPLPPKRSWPYVGTSC